MLSSSATPKTADGTGRDKPLLSPRATAQTVSSRPEMDRTSQAMMCLRSLLLDDREQGSTALQLGELVVAPLSRLVGRPGLTREPLVLSGAQLDTTNLSGDGFRQLRELDAPDPLVGRQVLARVLEDLEGGGPVRLVAGSEDDVGLRNREPQLVGGGHDGRFGNRRVLDEHALELERADLVVRGLEDVVGASDVGDVPLVVDGGDVAGVVPAARHRVGVPGLVSLVAGHQGERLVPTTREVQADLALAGLHTVAGDGGDDRDRAAGARTAHRSRLQQGAGTVAHYRGHLGLTVAVAKRQTPFLPDLSDHLGVERLTRTDHLP